MKAKAVTLVYLGGPWDGRSDKFETEVGHVTLPVWFHWEQKQIQYGKQHFYQRQSGFMVYQGVFNE